MRLLLIYFKLILLLLFSSQSWGRTNPTSGFDIILEINDVNCKGNSTGSVNAIIENGIPPFQFLWSTSDVLNHVDSLAAGNYSLTVSDSNGCVDSINFFITEPNEVLELSLVVDEPTCNGYNGWVISSVNGGTPPYHYSWNTGHTGPAEATSGFGNYALTVTDANDCSISESTYLSFQCELQVTATVNHVSCAGGNDGSVTLGYTGCVTGNVEYCLSGGACGSNNHYSGLSAGTYSFLAFTSPCASSISVTIEEPNIDTLSFTITDLTNIDCFNNYGQIEVEGAGGTPPYFFQWDNGNQTDLNDSLLQGYHHFTITDTNGCSVNDSTIIIMSPFLSAGNDTMLHFLCPNDPEPIEVTPVFEDSFTNYIFEWRYENGNLISTGDFSTLLTDSIGIYIFSAIDTVNGCSFSDSVNVNYNANFNPDTISSFPMITNATDGLNNGSINPNLSGGVPPYVYFWGIGSQAMEITDLSAGNYSLTVFDNNWCKYEFEYQIDNITGISDIDHHEMKIYPNPGDGLFKMDFKNNNLEFHQIKVYDSSGNFISKIGSDHVLHQSIDLRELANGVYIISVESKEGTKLSKRIVITK